MRDRTIEVICGSPIAKHIADVVSKHKNPSISYYGTKYRVKSITRSLTPNRVTVQLEAYAKIWK